MLLLTCAPSTVTVLFKIAAPAKVTAPVTVRAPETASVLLNVPAPLKFWFPVTIKLPTTEAFPPIMASPSTVKELNFVGATL